jgi:hypothetical protein
MIMAVQRKNRRVGSSSAGGMGWFGVAGVLPAWKCIARRMIAALASCAVDESKMRAEMTRPYG